LVAVDVALKIAGFINFDIAVFVVSACWAIWVVRIHSRC